MRARMALKLAETEYEHREVSLRDKPDAMLLASPKGSVPVFVTREGQIVDESLDIMRWALPETDLNMNLIRSIDGPFKHHLDRYKYASRYDETVERGEVDLSHRAEAVNLLQDIEHILQDSAFLSGHELGSTDMAIFPFIRQFAAVESNWWAIESGLAKTRDWLKTCLASELFNSIMTKYPLWTPAE